MKTTKPLHQLIREATGASAADVPHLEHIMREEIFHSTLDWQTREQLLEGARQARSRLEADREWYDLQWDCRNKIVQQMRSQPRIAAN